MHPLALEILRRPAVWSSERLLDLTPRSTSPCTFPRDIKEVGRGPSSSSWIRAAAPCSRSGCSLERPIGSAMSSSAHTTR